MREIIQLVIILAVAIIAIKNFNDIKFLKRGKGLSVTKKKRDFPEKKDLTYWLGFLIVLLIFYFVLVQTNPDFINSKLSLLGTLLSIVLAVVAIFFSFIQSASSTNQLNDVLGKVSDVQMNLLKLTKDIKVLEDVRNSLEKENEKKISTANKLNEILTHIKQSYTDQDVNQGNIDILKEEFTDQLNNINAEINVSGPNALYNSLLKYDVEKDPIHIQVLWKFLWDDGARMTMDNLKKDLLELERKGQIEFFDDEQTIISVKKH